MLDNIVQITPNDAATGKFVSSQLDPKTLQLIQKLAGRPLLLEKLLINESQGILLKTAFKGEKLTLQLPLSASRMLNNIDANIRPSQQPIVQLIINDKQQLAIVITVPAPKLSNQALTSNTTPTAVLPNTSSSSNPLLNQQQNPGATNNNSGQSQNLNAQPANTQTTTTNSRSGRVIIDTGQKQTAISAPSSSTTEKKPPLNQDTLSNQKRGSELSNSKVVSLLFKQASSNANQILILKQPIGLEGSSANIKGGELTSPSQQNTAQTFAAAANKQGSSVPQAQLSQPSVSKVPAAQTQVSEAQTKQPQTSPIQTSPILTTEARIDKVVRQLLKQNFAQQLPLSKFVEQLNQSLITIRAQNSSSPADSKLVEQLTNILASLNRPAKPTANAIKQRILSSGHLLESQLNKTVLTPKTTISSTANNRMSESNDQALPVKPGANRAPSTDQLNAGKQPVNDLKLQLLRVKTQIESIIRNLVNSSTTGSTTGSTQSQTSNQTSSQTPNQTTASTGQPNNTSNPLSNTFIQPNAASASGPLSADPVLAAGNKATQQPNTNSQQNNPLYNVTQLTLKQANELLGQVKAFVAQIESNQLLSLRNDQPNLVQFLVDLPFAHHSKIDSFELLFESSQSEETSKNRKHWKVVVRFDLPPLGPMFAQVELKDERLSTNIFAESEQTSKLLNEHLHVLKKSLFSAGVDVDEITGNQGHVPTRLKDNNELGIDTHA